MGSNKECLVKKTETAFGLRNKSKPSPHPRDVLITFQNQKVKSLVLEAYRDQPEWKVEGFELLVF